MNGISSSRNALIGLPALADSSSEISSACSSIVSASLIIASARSPGVVVDQPPNARRAACAEVDVLRAGERRVSDHLGIGGVEHRLGLAVGRIGELASMKF